MEVVRKVPVSEDLYRILVGCESDINDLFFRRFQCTAEVTGPRIAASSAAVKVYEKRLRGGLLISVWKDDLTRQVVDVVVNAANENLDHIGGLAYALVEAGGQQIVQESKDRIKKKGILVAGEIAVTSGGSLPIKKIIHAVGPRWSIWIAEECRAQLEKAIKQVLVYMRDHTDLHSVAIPAISSGIFGFPLDLCATIIVETIHRFCNNEDRHRLKEIRLVNHDDKTVQAMRAACEQILGSSDPYTSKTSSSHSAVSSSHSPVSSSRSATSSSHSAVSSSHSSVSSSRSATSSSHSAMSSSHSATSSSHSPVSSSRSVTSSSYSGWPRQGHQEGPSQMSVSLSGLNLHLKTGKIEDEKSAVIVNSVSQDLNLNYGAISTAIYKKAGYQLQKEIWEKRSLWRGNMIPTMGYSLPCGHVYHVILPPGGWKAEKTLQDVTNECLLTAHTYGAPSISFPALGTGNIGLQKHKVADIMTQTVLDFARGSQCKMDVYFIIHPSDTDTFKAFQDKLRASGTITDKDMEVSERRTGPEPSAEETCVIIAGERGDEAAAWLQDLLFSRAPLLTHDNHLLLFGSKEFDDLASGPPGVDIEEDLRDGRVTLKISGPQPERVTAAIQAELLLLDVQEELAESLEEELLETAIIWFYESRSITHKYSAKAIRELENAYSSQTNITLKASPGHKIDIMKRTAQDSEQTFHIQRRCLSDTLRNIQVSLTPGMTLSQTKMVDPSSQEFSDRSKEFRKAGLVLLKMEKVQNKLLSAVFQCKKDAVEQRLKKPSTETLYQLVPGQFWRKICDVGFHRMYTTPRDTKHGAGIYFKKTLPNIAQRFQSPEKDALLYILQAEVVIGAAAKYSRTQPVLPCVGGDALRVCDSLVNGGIPADLYVIFDRFQANPTYVFTCTCKK